MSPQKTSPKQKQTVTQQRALQLETLDERLAKGKSLRDILPRKEQSAWQASAKRRDPIAILESGSRGRIEELIPVRYGRMLKSPFAFFRGSAAIMAADLSTTAVTGIRVQACGDCHLMNFGAYATPERNLIVDINDFDETLPAAWEWDVKRLATSFVLACRENGFKPAVAAGAAEVLGCSYREAMHEFAEMRVLDVWYSKMDLASFVKGVSEEELRKDVLNYIAKQKQKSILEYMVPKLTVAENGRRRFKDVPPYFYHSEDQRGKNFMDIAQRTFMDYKTSLSPDRQVLLDRYQLSDVAMKVVGIGSVGTYCAVLLLYGSPDDPLILQAKEARPSVLEEHAGKSKCSNHGQRIVLGQRLMQSHSDIFLGWATGAGHLKRHFYFRQLKDQKMSLMPETWTPSRASEVADVLGWVLARAHARSGDPTMIAGYLGTKDVFDQALAKFAVGYADQVERDHQLLVSAVKSGRLDAFVER
ncbi:MAG TPA: DUF2252 domain-containing protein [Candidatus Obscuribacterales bacterium]